MMDCARKTPKIFCNWRDRPKISIPKTGDAEEEEDGEKRSLLPSAMAGKKKARKKNDSNNQKRRVQWNDDHGDKLTQVLEFFPRLALIQFIYYSCQLFNFL